MKREREKMTGNKEYRKNKSTAESMGIHEPKGSKYPFFIAALLFIFVLSLLLRP
jgi:hypothetical protein